MSKMSIVSIRLSSRNSKKYKSTNNFIMINLSKAISENQLTIPPQICFPSVDQAGHWPSTTTIQFLHLHGQDQEQDIPQHLQDGRGRDVTVRWRKGELHEGHMDGSMEDLCTTENKRSLSFLLIFSDVLFHKSKSFDQVDDKKINRMHKDLIKSVMAFQ